MAILDIARGQEVAIPAIQLTNGKPFRGVLRASDGESLMIDLHERCTGSLPKELDDMCVLTWENEGVQRACPILLKASSPRTIVAQVVIQERRESPRIRIDMDLTYERVPMAQVKQVAEAVMARMNAVGDPQSESLRLLKSTDDGELSQLHQDVLQLRDMMSEIISRLDMLTTAVTGQPTVTSSAMMPLQIQNVSSTGAGFIGYEALQSGDYVRLHMVIHSTPRTVVDCMGVVVRCTRVDGENGLPPKFDVGLRYTHIHESDRERLIHYLFQIQRRMLRDLKEARQTMAEKA
jgi:hypothetical protein